MSLKGAIASALQFLVVFALFLLGLFFIMLPSLPLTRMEIIEFLSTRYQTCTQIGLGIFFVGFLFLLGFYAANRGKYLVIKMGISLDLKVIRQAVHTCFAKQFPKKISLKEVKIGSKSELEFKVHTPITNEAEREELYIQVEKQLGILLKERFRSSKPFYLIVNQ